MIPGRRSWAAADLHPAGVQVVANWPSPQYDSANSWQARSIDAGVDSQPASLVHGDAARQNGAIKLAGPEALLVDFDRATGGHRLLMLVSPTCDDCLAGVGMARRALSAFPNASV